MTFPMIETVNLTKYFGDLGAVQSISLSVAKGEIFGLLGPNGAGKTTTIRMLTTLSSPTSGSVYVAGHDATTEPLSVKRSIGVVPQMLNLDIESHLCGKPRIPRKTPQDAAGRSRSEDRGTSPIHRAMGEEECSR